MRARTYLARNFATLGPLELRPPFTGASVASFHERLPTPFTFRHWAGVSPHILSCDFAETCVFGKQSPGPGHCGSRSLLRATPPLLPKLRGQFAEFLRESCLAPLGMLYLPTCVGFRYRSSLVCSSWSFSRRGISSFILGVSLHPLTPHSLYAVDTRYGQLGNPPDPPCQPEMSTGMFTCFPSATPLGLALGPD